MIITALKDAAQARRRVASLHRQWRKHEMKLLEKVVLVEDTIIIDFPQCFFNQVLAILLLAILIIFLE